MPKEVVKTYDCDENNTIRMEYLLVQNTSFIRHKLIADAKAAAILGAAGILGVQGQSLPLTGDDLGPLAMLFLIFVCVSIGSCVASIYARYPSKRYRQSLHEIETWSWASLSTNGLSAANYSDGIEAQSISHLYRSLAYSNATMAKVLERKFFYQRVAFLSAIAALVTWVIPMTVEHGYFFILTPSI